MEKTCPVCGGELVLTQEDVFLRFDTPFRLGDYLSMNVFQCADCKRLEFYGVDPVKNQEPDPSEIVICPDCGQEHSMYINCPHCLMSNGLLRGRVKEKKEKEKEQKHRKNTGDPWDFK